MKTSSAPGTRKTVDRPTAWACTLTNLTTVPGLGTLAAGRKIGYAQAALALLGFGISTLWLVLTVREWMAKGELPVGFTPTLWLGLGGVSAFIVAWVWALITSVDLQREAGRNAASDPSQTEE